MKALGFKIKMEGLEHFQKNQNYLIVANHVSYVDVTLICSFVRNNCFITHYEWKESNPFLNLISEKSRCVFCGKKKFKKYQKRIKGNN